MFHYFHRFLIVLKCFSIFGMLATERCLESTQIRPCLHLTFSINGLLLLPAATKLGQSNVFTGVCDSVQGGVLPQCMLGYPPPPQDQTCPQDQTPPGTRHPPPGTRPPWDHTPPPDQTPPGTIPPPEIRSTSGRYASYWNAFLFSIVLIVTG